MGPLVLAIHPQLVGGVAVEQGGALTVLLRGCWMFADIARVRRRQAPVLSQN